MVVNYLIEVSWEVANKVGGIYSVISTKVPYSSNLAKEYILIGPYFKGKKNYEFDELQPKGKYAKLKNILARKGIDMHYGVWQIKGQPKVILVDFSNYWEQKNYIKGWLWEHYGIDSLFAQYDFDEPTVWAWTTGIVIEELHKIVNDSSFVAHFHEWLSGAALLYLKKIRPEIKTVFTTHATTLGRTLASSGRDLYREISNINPDEEAKKYNVQAKHLTEKACALNADLFTTVSEITGYEAEKFFGKAPDVLLPNGLDISLYPTLEEITLLHIRGREALREFVSYYFFPYYKFDLRHNLFFYISGRYEYRNKGMDIVIRALAKLNEALKESNSHRTITTFFFVPLANRGIRIDVLENKNKYEVISNFVDKYKDEIVNNIKAAVISNLKLSQRHIIPKEMLIEARKHMLGFEREGNPPISTHYLQNENEAIVQDLIRFGLDNKEDDKVKVVLYPVYLSENDGLLGMPYYHVIAGCHLGIFPSYYEPWGYTPLESASLGTPAITSDLSGFGRHVVIKQSEYNLVNKGIYVIKRFERTDDQAVEELFNVLYNFATLHHPERVHERVAAKSIAELFGWDKLILHYKEAYRKLLQ